MKKFLLSLLGLALGSSAFATDTVLWEGTQVIDWNQSCVVAASKCANMQADQQIIVEYECVAGADYYSLGLIKGYWGNWPAGTWETGGVSAGTNSKVFDIPEACLSILKSEGFFLMGYGLEVHKIIWRDEVRDKSVLLEKPLVVAGDSEGITFTYTELVAAGAAEGCGVKVEFTPEDGGYINYMHQGNAENEYEWCEFTDLQVSEADGTSILILNKTTLDEINTFGKTLVIQVGHATINRIKIIPALEIPGTSIVLDQSSAEVMAGRTLQLTATTNPEGQKVTWTSSDEKVATVDYNGLVTAVAEGTATITAAAGTGSATCTLTVTPAAKIMLKWVNSSREEIYGDEVDITEYVDNGRTPRLIVTTIPEDAKISFTSTMDPDKSFSFYGYASSKEAEVSLKSPGKLTVTVKMTGYTDVEATASITAIELDKPYIRLGYYDKSGEDMSPLQNLLVGSIVKLSPHIYPSTNYGELEESYEDMFDYEWTSSNPGIVDLTPESRYNACGTVTALKAGTTTITVSIGGSRDLPRLTQSVDVTVTNSGEMSYVYNFSTPNRGSSYSWITAYGFDNSNTSVADFDFIGKTQLGTDIVSLIPSEGTVSPLTFPTGSTLALKSLDPYVRLRSMGISGWSTEVKGDHVLNATASEGTVEGSYWKTATEEGVADVTLTATADITTASYTYWHVAMFRYAVPETVELNETEFEDFAEATLELAATYGPEDALPGLEFEWASSDEAVATVSEKGLVTLVAEGEATITAKLVAPAPVGEEAPELAATCAVKVLKAESGIEDVVIDLNDTTTEVYNLQGMRMRSTTDLTPGIYVVRKGGKTSKVIVK